MSAIVIVLHAIMIAVFRKGDSVMVRYIVTTRQIADGVSLPVDSAAEAIRAVREFARNHFSVIILDERGRERSIEDIETQAAIEANNNRL